MNSQEGQPLRDDELTDTDSEPYHTPEPDNLDTLLAAARRIVEAKKGDNKITEEETKDAITHFLENYKW